MAGKGESASTAQLINLRDEAKAKMQAARRRQAATCPRSYCLQYGESDYAFVFQMLAEEGIGWRVDDDKDTPAGHLRKEEQASEFA